MAVLTIDNGGSPSSFVAHISTLYAVEGGNNTSTPLTTFMLIMNDFPVDDNTAGTLTPPFGMYLYPVIIPPFGLEGVNVTVFIPLPPTAVANSGIDGTVYIGLPDATADNGDSPISFIADIWILYCVPLCQ